MANVERMLLKRLHAERAARVSWQPQGVVASTQTSAGMGMLVAVAAFATFVVSGGGLAKIRYDRADRTGQGFAALPINSPRDMA